MKRIKFGKICVIFYYSARCSDEIKRFCIEKYGFFCGNCGKYPKERRVGLLGKQAIFFHFPPEGCCADTQFFCCLCTVPMIFFQSMFDFCLFAVFYGILQEAWKRLDFSGEGEDAFKP